MSKRPMPVQGKLLGVRTDPRGGGARDEIVHVVRDQRPRGPAENALIRVRVEPGGTRRARYISWINYGDLDEASAAEPGAWRLVEPAEPYVQSVVWTPFAPPMS